MFYKYVDLHRNKIRPSAHTVPDKEKKRIYISYEQVFFLSDLASPTAYVVVI